MVVAFFNKDVIAGAKEMGSMTGSAQSFGSGQSSTCGARPEKVISSMMGQMTGTAGVVLYTPGMRPVQCQAGPAKKND
jgi:hypothetical protein